MSEKSIRIVAVILGVILGILLMRMYSIVTEEGSNESETKYDVSPDRTSVSGYLDDLALNDAPEPGSPESQGRYNIRRDMETFAVFGWVASGKRSPVIYLELRDDMTLKHLPTAADPYTMTTADVHDIPRRRSLQLLLEDHAEQGRDKPLVVIFVPYGAEDDLLNAEIKTLLKSAVQQAGAEVFFALKPGWEGGRYVGNN